VAETKEFAANLKTKTKLHFGPLFVNAIMPEILRIKEPKEALPQDLQTYWDYYELARNRFELNHDYTKDIEKDFSDFEKIFLPFQFKDLSSSKDFAPLLEKLKGELRT
jgi:hypothetical protein